MVDLRHHVNTVLLLLVLFALLAVIGMLASGVRGGPLDPGGAPGSTDGVRLPGTPIASLPYVITQSGHYYLTRNLQVVSGDGITIDAENVTLDLMGFALTGPGSAGNGVTSDSVATRWNNTIRNGVIRGWANGILTPNFVRGTFEDLRVTHNGVGMEVGSGNAVRRVLSGYNTSRGLVITQRGDAWGGSVEDSNFSRNAGNGVRIRANSIWIHDNVIDSNSGGGVYVSAVGGDGDFNEITDNRITGNTGAAGVALAYDGIADGADNNVVARNVFADNPMGAVTDQGANNKVGTFVGDSSLGSTYPWSNIAY